MRLSYSSLTTFKQCPKKYLWQYVKRLRVPPTPDQFFGILIHQVLELALKNDPIVEPLDRLVQFYGKKWNDRIFNGELSSEEYYQEGLRIIKNFYSDYQPGLRTILYTEKFFELLYEGHTIVGKIDRIDKLPTGEIEVVDYKTNRKLPHDDDFKYDLQLAMYHWGASSFLSNLDTTSEVKEVSRLGGVQKPKIKMTLHYLRHNQKITPQEITTRETLQKYILESVENISKTDHQPTPSRLCGWCEYLHLCEEGQAFLKEKQIPNNKLQMSNKSQIQNSNDQNNPNKLTKLKANEAKKYPKDSLFANLD